MAFPQAEHTQGAHTGESSQSHLPSRNPCVESEDEAGVSPHAQDHRPSPAGSHAVDDKTGSTSNPEVASSGSPSSPEQPPSLPARQPGKEPAGSEDSGSAEPETRPELPPRPKEQGPGDGHPRPPQRRLTTGDIPVNAVEYTRDPETLVAYLIPLPPPSHKGQTLAVPQRYVLYTPPAPHLLKPLASGGAKEGKRHRARRLAQHEVKKAKTYEGKTLCLRGLHYKALRGCDRAVAAIKNPDITFLNRVPRRRVGELVLIHPASVSEHHSPGQVHAEVAAQLARTRRKAAQHSVVSTLLFPPSLVVDTLAAVVWPFGGLAEIDAVWMYTSISGYLTARSVTRRMDREPTVDEGDGRGEEDRLQRGLSPVSEEDMYSAGAGAAHTAGAGGEDRVNSRRDGRQVRFEEMLDDEDEVDPKEAARPAGRDNNSKRPLKVRMVPDEAMDTMASYFQEACHQRNPKAFGSPGVPPTKTDVLASIGWWPDRRGRAPGVERPGDWEDENWQTRQVKEDLERVLAKAAKSWDKWCKSYAKYPERTLKEKGHSRSSGVLRKLHIRKDRRGPSVVV